MELLTEFMQELPYTTAADAWQRSVHLGRELPLDPKSEPRLKTAKDDPQLTASHPFFWAGYLLIDTGAVVQNGEDEAPVARLDAASDAEP